ncbi:PREDICTED: FAR1-RELATED SEQUENCE, partial [Prunus dulcis]
KPNFGECFSEMKKCIWSMDKKEEFDAKWEEIITNNGLQDHAWLSSIHAMRENWVPSYVEHLPDKYILKRWLQSAKSGVIYDKNHKEVNDYVDGLLLVKRSKVCKVASDLIDSALLCDEGFELLEKSFEDIRGKLT